MSGIDHIKECVPHDVNERFGWGRRLSKDVLSYAARSPALAPLTATSSRHELGCKELWERRLCSWFPGEPSGATWGTIARLVM